MRELNTERSVPITVTGTFQRPTLVLTFEGMLYEGRAVSGAFRGDYMECLILCGSRPEGYEWIILIGLEETQ